MRETNGNSGGPSIGARSDLGKSPSDLKTISSCCVCVGGLFLNDAGSLETTYPGRTGWGSSTANVF